MKLLQIKENAEEKKRLVLLLKKVKLELHALETKYKKLDKLAKKELKDVEHLEGSGLSSVFYSILGNKVEKLDKERQEYIAAKLKLDNCKNEITELKKEIDELNLEHNKLGDPESEYLNLINTKKEKLKNKQDSGLIEYEKQLSFYFSQNKEITEAVAAGERVLQGLHYAIQSLQKAKNWGVVDMVGGGLITTAIKHSNIDDSKEMIQGVQVWLRKFKREIADIQISEIPDLNVQLSSFSTFADYFFDNLIFDWVVQSKINRSYEGCVKLQNQVSTIVNQLKKSKSNVGQKYSSIKKEFNSYLENT